VAAGIALGKRRMYHPSMVTFQDIQTARTRIAQGIAVTPCLHAQTLSTILGCELWLKFENLQFTASFKDRGALNKLLQLTEDEKRRGVIAMSAGNHAQGVAYHARRLGIPATMVMPRGTPFVKVRNTQAHGATVVMEGDSLAEAATAAHRICDEKNLVFVHPYDDAAIIAGQGTIALEMLEAAPLIDTLVVPVGGGGMIAGMAVAAKHINPTITIVGVETQQYAAMQQRLAGETVSVGGETIAEGIAVRDTGALPLALAKQYVERVVTVSEETIERAIVMLLEIEKTVTEGAGAAGLAALIAHPELFRGKKVGVVLCGGNIDTRLLASILLRGLKRDGRLVRIRTRVPDVAGSLAKMLTLVGETGANLIDVFHQRVFSHVSAKRTEIELTLETRDRNHVAQIIETLRSKGIDAQMLDEVDADV
jgi:threonine dehydratase